jgi:hypothetical protein
MWSAVKCRIVLARAQAAVPANVSSTRTVKNEIRRNTILAKEGESADGFDRRAPYPIARAFGRLETVKAENAWRCAWTATVADSHRGVRSWTAAIARNWEGRDRRQS